MLMLTRKEAGLFTYVEHQFELSNGWCRFFKKILEICEASNKRWIQFQNQGSESVVKKSGVAVVRLT